MGSSAPLQFSDNSSHLVFWHQIFDTTMMYLNRFDPQPTYKWIISATLLLSMVTILVIETSVPRDRRRLPVAKYTPSSFEHAKLRHQNRKAGTIPSQGINPYKAPTPPSVPCPEPIKSMKEVNEQHAREKRAKKLARKHAKKNIMKEFECMAGCLRYGDPISVECSNPMHTDGLMDLAAAQSDPLCNGVDSFLYEV